MEGAKMLISVEKVTVCTEIFASSVSVHVKCHQAFQTIHVCTNYLLGR